MQGFTLMAITRPIYIQNMACVVTNEDMCSFGYLSVVHHRMRQTSSIALNERLKQTKKLCTQFNIHNISTRSPRRSISHLHRAKSIDREI